MPEHRRKLPAFSRRAELLAAVAAQVVVVKRDRLRQDHAGAPVPAGCGDLRGEGSAIT